MRARLDRAVASLEWSEYFRGASVEHICSSRSDHLPLLLRFGKRKEWRPVLEASQKVFRYEHMWERVDSLKSTIEDSWKGSGTAKNLQEVGAKMLHMQKTLLGWAERDFGSVIKRTAEICRKLSILWSGRPTAEQQRKIKECTKELDELLLREELMWLQRSRATYLREGDRNTKWFKQKATWRKKKNDITKLKDSSGVWIEDREGIQEMSRNFFMKLYEKDREVNPNSILELVNRSVTEEMNKKLVRPFSAEEISNALFQIGLLKAPGPDGFPAPFFQWNWEILKDEVIKGVLGFFENGVLPEGINDTVIVMTPKGKDPQSLKDYRPISLCNVLYKVISKCLVNRLRPLLDEIIPETQSAFIPGRLITDNATIAFECFHKIEHSRSMHNTHCAYELDLAKAYDRVDWNFLEQLLLKTGFNRKWTSWIMQCVRSVRYIVRCNGVLLEPFVPSRGLRQGDPLSPYLFLFVVDSLVNLMKKEIAEGNPTPLKIPETAQTYQTFCLQKIA